MTHQSSSSSWQDAIELSLEYRLYEEERAEVGFSSLIAALQEARQGKLPTTTVEDFRATLEGRLTEARGVLERMQIPEAVRPHIEPFLRTTWSMLEDMEASLCWVDDYLDGDLEAADRATDLLQAVEADLHQVAERMQG